MHYFTLVILIATVCGYVPSVEAQRYALVIGNSNYKEAALKNPVNDANDMAVLLKEKGFKVQKLTDADERERVGRCIVNQSGFDLPTSQSLR